jgi:flavin-dependent dehydrogenase
MIRIKSDYEVLVLGAGPTGSALAAILAGKGLSVLLLNKTSHSYQFIGENLSASSRDVLDLLDIDPAQLDVRHQPVYQMVSWWNAQAPIVKNSLYVPMGHGWHLDKAVFNNDLLEKARKAGADYCSAVSIKVDIKRAPCGVSFITAQEQRHITCAIVADCTGRAHFISKQSGARIRRWDTLIAINAVIPQTQEEEEAGTIIEAEENGWWYSGKIGKASRVISFFTDARSAVCKQRVKTAAFRSALGRTRLVGSSIAAGSECQLSVPTLRSANSEMPEKIAGDHWVAVGDAAAAYDPLSSQGISTGLQMAVRVAEIIACRKSSIRRDGFRQYEEDYRQSFIQYLQQRQSYYASVRRWPESDFWKSNSAIQPLS